MSIRTLFLLGALIPAIVSAGCGGGKDNANAAKANDEKGETKNAAGDRSPADAGLDSLTPENSMRRDLELLRERENAQAEILSEMRGRLNENENMLKREENRLAEMRTQITRYEEALGLSPPGAARNGFAGQTEPALADTGFDFSGYDPLFQRRANANTARRAAAPEQPQAAAASKDEPGQTFIRGENHFAGAPRGRARTDFSVGQPRRNEGEIVVWNPNDPNQAVPPEVSLGMEYVPPETPARPPAIAAGPAPAIHRSDDKPSDAPSFGKYATETFSPDLFLGKNG